ncbi:MAG: 16S rRNA (uracil(1498)-N(3))-methyltransferase [Microcoleus sp. PH2017_01_SCD_O_A]|uniref:RsmE family RNA methyltransferase n=1 Tax=unclassified Microcoleus TaxID=2642155 RepID=UPI001DF61C07|nr:MULTISPECIES: RsmE family RNA methyltransferase [unclassified Microcoleus]TAE12012.1 MAG: 16S rRNA (uracil(1498)-N(3))-methyltransferase [Oscillatoriales cyanobacterium]MCC3426483.1 16S rRNA (uracil(1498)-N(3))-methyltransferase [Microcoleus sp. PH2017_01_SCD_O_A]MCC3491512.1 16S rRNA (uracil(1498)-N(3))-methyltransferase [Microcoleus sp. PH2017_16_JOR_D_A]MCC3535088.1 16S rRNA (uracil(1498)-N(3))-methyltransferase [Microcoleus sp. PH2017_25_DOB_D_A]MCC3547364.1 16S rRNA (uracil(1498)-N(3))
MAQLQRLAVTAAQISANKIDLTKEQQHYLNRVLRLQAGDRFIAMDGCGHWWSAILEVQETGLFASIKEEIAVNRELPVAVTLIAALPKGNGFDEVVRQAAELGVASIVPVTSDRTLLKPSTQKVDRWRRIAAEAAEQSERQIVPTVYEPLSFDLAVKDCCQKYRYICVARGDNRHLWDCLIGLEPPQPPLLRGEQDGEDPPQPPLIRGEQDYRGELSIAIAIGPEGGWTDGEVERAIEFGFEPVSLGRRILRAVTAPMVALSLVGAAFEKYPSQKISP